MKSFKTLFKRSFMHGLLYFLPLVLTVYVFVLILQGIHSLLSFSRAVIPPEYRDSLAVVLCTEAVALALLVLVTSLIGIGLRTFLGKIAKDNLVRLLNAVPVLNSIYAALSQVLEILFKNRQQMFSKAVVIDFPHPGKRAIAFVTGEAGPALTPVKDHVYRTVFVPTTPNPTSGFLLLLPPAAIRVTDFPAETGFKLILSGGIVEEYPESKPAAAPLPTPPSQPRAATDGKTATEQRGGWFRWRWAFIDGVILTMPTVLTLYVGYLIFDWIYGYLSHVQFLVPDGMLESLAVKFAVETLALGVLIGLIALLGLAVHNMVGVMLQKQLLRVMDTLPVVRMVFRGMLEFVKLLFSHDSRHFSKVVLVEFPYPGCWAIGFVTGEADPRLCGDSARKHFKVFVAGTPNPTNGFLFIVPETAVVITALTVEQGLRIVLTGGILRE